MDHPGYIPQEPQIVPDARERALRNYEHAQERVHLARAALREAEVDLERAAVCLEETRNTNNHQED